MESVTIALSVSDMVKTELLERYPWIDWSKVAVLELTKKAIFDKYVKTGKLSKADSEFCDRVDWHPVDWLPLKKEFVEKLKKAAKEPVGKPMSEKLSESSKAKVLQKLDKMLEKSELTEEDCIRLGRELKERVWKRYKKEGW
ncbi:MAG: hypothetical protein QME12_07265 [Nanoarchaeota archaeon]|nr:hypothetical protein [Nanoarchaeota archaeon]